MKANGGGVRNFIKPSLSIEDSNDTHAIEETKGRYHNQASSKLKLLSLDDVDIEDQVELKGVGMRSKKPSSFL